MRKLKAAAIILMALSLGACAGLSRTAEYHGLADAKVRVGTRAYSVWFHKTDKTVLVQRAFGAAMGQSFVSGLTFGAANMTEPMPYWRAAAQAPLAPIGCTVGDVYTLDNRITWEARYICPEGTDVGAYVAAHRPEWRAKGLEVGDPMKVP